MPLSSKKILLGISGGIAAYKACDLVRRLRDQGAEVHVVMTRGACQFVTPLTLQALSGNPVHTELFDLDQESKMSHIALAELPDLILVAPATADFMAKLAHGFCDDLLTTLFAVSTKPKILCPSMNVNMWNNPAHQDNLKLLKERGMDVIQPDSGSLACGYEGMGRLPDPLEIIRHLETYFTESVLQGLKLLVTAGPTWEPIDPVRHITSPASGKTGFALAERAAKRGAQVFLVSGPTSLTDPAEVQVTRVKTAEEMAQAVFKKFSEMDIVIASAAVSDFRPRFKLAQKAKKSEINLHLELAKNKDILAELGKLKRKNQILVGFAAETENIAQEALRKLKEKNLDLICANDISRDGLGFASEKNQLTLYWPKGQSQALPVLLKEKLADSLLDAIEELVKDQTKVNRISV